MDEGNKDTLLLRELSITLLELDWITENENSFSRIDMAMLIKLGRLMDEGLIEIDCRQTA